MKQLKGIQSFRKITVDRGTWQIRYYACKGLAIGHSPEMQETVHIPSSYWFDEKFHHFPGVFA